MSAYQPNPLPAIAELKAQIEKALTSPESEVKTSLDPLKQAQVNDLIANTELKKFYAKWFLVILAVQLLIMNLVFLGVGRDCLTYKDGWDLKIYMSGTLAEVFGVILVITRYLFYRKK